MKRGGALRLPWERRAWLSSAPAPSVDSLEGSQNRRFFWRCLKSRKTCTIHWYFHNAIQKYFPLNSSSFPVRDPATQRDPLDPLSEDAERFCPTAAFPSLSALTSFISPYILCSSF
ncbi:uncharacterized protein BJX67DRAFT_360077 [Aspergillus lucknowensis]|uniref:Uncharacterized protein n=1 Tax=Aspergillus lucknowensis TaxID=176173 RepID=A0ABR4LNC5_9EURO